MPDPMSPTAAAPPRETPFGASSATGPTPNQGYEAQALQQLGVTIKQLEKLVPMVGANSELGMELLKVLPKLAKFSPPGAVTPAGERNTLEAAMLQNARQGPMLQQLRAAMAGGGGAPGGAPGAAAPGAPPQPRTM